MPRVVVLEKEVADKIAAGEVVDRPASVVKELVENSLDAGASRIEVELEDGGKRRITIRDNGCGMVLEDAVLALERHATSKIRAAEDLFSIRTLGFRGEALPSIAAVSHLRILTRAEGEDAGVEIRVERGEVSAAEERGAPQGTEISVTDLFHNVPARLKFLKPAQTELSHIVDLVVRFALSYPKVHFKLAHNGKPVFQAPGGGDPLNTVVAAYGREVAKEMLPVASPDGALIAVRGYVSRPAVSRAGRSHQSFFVNGRLVRTPVLARALDEAYKGLLPAGRFPAACLFVTVDPGDVDVNVHPTKMEVRFADERTVYDMALRAVRSALVKADLAMPAFAPRPEGVEQSIRAQSAGWDPFAGPADRSDGSAESDRPDAAGGPPAAPYHAPTAPPPALPERRPEWTLRSPAVQPSLGFETDPFGPRMPLVPGAGAAPPLDAPGSAGAPSWPAWPAPEAPPAPSPPPVADVPGAPEALPAGSAPDASANPIPDLVPVARVLDTYVVCEGADAVYIIDQHAAHERVLYDALLARRGDDIAPQQLLIPLTLSLSHADAVVLESHRDALAELGFEIEPFGRDTYVLRSVPVLLVGRNYARVLQDVIDDLRERDRSGRMEDERAEVCALLACHSVIRSGDTLSPEEMRRLVDDLRRSPAPYTCAHGRPTMLVLSRGELERKIGR